MLFDNSENSYSAGTTKRLLTAAVSLATLSIACPVAASAQTASTTTATKGTEGASDSAPAAADGDDAAGKAIVITGSRVARVGFVAPSPITAVSAEDLRAANPGSFNDALRQLPILSNSAGPRGATGNSGTSGSFLNLRRLGGPRTLVLLDGRRFVSTNQTGTVDTALFPEALVRRVDIVTGGASAAYGSDAVAGVVNFVLDKNMKGLRGEAMYGQLENGLSPEYRLSLAGGMSFGGDDRGHLLASAEYYQNKGIIEQSDIMKTQDWVRQQCAVIQNPGGTTARTFACDTRVSNESLGGLVISGPLKGLQFDNSGNLVPFNTGTLTSATQQVGGDGPLVGYRSPIVGSSRLSFFGRASWDLGDDVTAYVEGSYGETTSDFYVGIHSQFQTSTALVIKNDNPYLTTDTKNRMAAANVTSISIGRYDLDISRPKVYDLNRTQRFVGGFEGETGGAHWSAYFQHGENRVNHEVSILVNNDNTFRAVDAVRAPNGSIVCRSTLTDPNNGCVPINMMGQQQFTAQQLGYFTGKSYYYGVLKQDVAAATVSGDIFQLPAGPVSLAGGFEYRRESIKITADPVSKAISSVTGVAGQYQTGNFADQAGGYEVKEGFLETVFPLLRDQPFARELEFNGAVRRTHYSTSGDVTTWKGGLTWRPFDFIRFRGTRSRDIRAPNLSELYNAGSSGRGNVVDQFYNPPRTAAGVLNVNKGNPNLQPEIANTLTFGAVFTPKFLPNLDISLDAYNIDIRGAITSPSATQITLDCRNGSTEACSRAVRDSAGNLTTIYILPVNLSQLKASGVDLEVAYHFNLSSITSALPGAVSLRFLGTYVDQSYTVAPGAAIVDRTGDSSQPRWRWTLNAGWRSGPLNIATQLRYTGSGPYDSTTLATDLPQRKLPGQVLVNLNVDYSHKLLGGEYSVFFNVQNLFNTQSPPFGDLNVYDTLGRAFRGGIRFKY